MNVSPASLSRRGFLTASGVGLAGMLLAGCNEGAGSSPSASGGAFTGSLTNLLPGDTPTGWDGIYQAVNTKLKADLGFEFSPQFIAWANYRDQALLKFTAGDSFDSSLQARWLSLVQLVGDGALLPLNELWDSGDYPNLTGTIEAEYVELQKWSDGNLWGIPQINGAARLQHACIRSDLASGEITSFDQWEQYLYDVVQKNSGMVGFGLGSGSEYLFVCPGPTAVFHAECWDDPSHVLQLFSGGSVPFYFDVSAASSGSSNPIPFWELEGMVDTLARVYQYREDGITNADSLNIDNSQVNSLFTSGKIASRGANTDGLSSTVLGVLQGSVPGAELANVMPLTGGLSAHKPNQTFRADNYVVVPATSKNPEALFQLLDWLSIKENHDLLQYGVEGTDWKPVGDDKYEALTQYSFPGFALSWRAPLELRSNFMTDSESTIFDWAQSTDNFTTDTFARFIPDVSPVEQENSQVVQAMSTYGQPLFAGAVEPVKGLSDLQKALETAGLEKLQNELTTQADAYLAQQS